MASVERRVSSVPQGELLKGKELYAREQDAWKNVLGSRVDVVALPDYVMPEG